MKKKLKVFFAAFVLNVGILFPAKQSLAMFETLKFHGFASQGFILTSDNNFFGPSEEGSFKYHEAGMGASIRPAPDLQFSAQVLSRRAGAGDRGGIRLDYALMDYRYVTQESNLIGVRIGRVHNAFGFYNDTPRHVAFTRPSIFLPQSIYFDRTQNLARSSDGIHLYSEHRSEYGDLLVFLTAGYANVDNDEST